MLADAGGSVGGGGGREEKGLVGSCIAGCCGSGATVLPRPSPVELRRSHFLSLSLSLYLSTLPTHPFFLISSNSQPHAAADFPRFCVVSRCHALTADFKDGRLLNLEKHVVYLT